RPLLIKSINKTYYVNVTRPTRRQKNCYELVLPTSSLQRMTFMHVKTTPIFNEF
ncbi:hypothetical protein L9F63_000155, partial [Diploptera punctata]